MVSLIDPEELLVERILVSVYPQPNREALVCAKKFLAVALKGQLELDWQEVKRLSKSPEYRIFSECKALIRRISNEIKTPNPFDSQG